MERNMEEYDIGVRLLNEKIQNIISLYNEIAKDFNDYGMICLSDTVIKGIPEFLKWYDTTFAPHETMLTLDYPVLKDITKLKGVDAIYEYLRCIRLEQIFLSRFDESKVRNMLYSYCDEYKDIFENICDIVLMFMFKNLDSKNDTIENQIIKMIETYYLGDMELLSYLLVDVNNLKARLSIYNDVG